jgi:hypothetical protein
MPEEPRRNQQFGQKIGVDDTSPPQVGHGRRHDSEMVDDPDQGQKARFVLPLAERPPPQEASEASEYGERPEGPPQGEVGLPLDEESVWDARPDEDADAP